MALYPVQLLFCKNTESRLVHFTAVFFAAAVIELSSQTTKVYNFTTQIRNLLALTHGRQFFSGVSEPHLVLDHR